MLLSQALLPRLLPTELPSLARESRGKRGTRSASRPRGRRARIALSALSGRDVLAALTNTKMEGDESLAPSANAFMRKFVMMTPGAQAPQTRSGWSSTAATTSVASTPATRVQPSPAVSAELLTAESGATGQANQRGAAENAQATVEALRAELSAKSAELLMAKDKLATLEAVTRERDAACKELEEERAGTKRLGEEIAELKRKVAELEVRGTQWEKAATFAATTAMKHAKLLDHIHCLTSVSEEGRGGGDGGGSGSGGGETSVAFAGAGAHSTTPPAENAPGSLPDPASETSSSSRPTDAPKDASKEGGTGQSPSANEAPTLPLPLPLPQAQTRPASPAAASSSSSPSAKRTRTSAPAPTLEEHQNGDQPPPPGSGGGVDNHEEEASDRASVHVFPPNFEDKAQRAFVTQKTIFDLSQPPFFDAYFDQNSAPRKINEMSIRLAQLADAGKRDTWVQTVKVMMRWTSDKSLGEWVPPQPKDVHIKKVEKVTTLGRTASCNFCGLQIGPQIVDKVCVVRASNKCYHLVCAYAHAWSNP